MPRLHFRIGDANHAAADAVARVAGGLRFQIVGLRVDDDGASDDRVRAAERDHRINALVRGFAARVGLDVAEIAGMAVVAALSDRFASVAKTTRAAIDAARGGQAWKRIWCR